MPPVKKRSHRSIRMQKKLYMQARRAAKMEEERKIREQLQKADAQLYQSLESLGQTLQDPQANQSKSPEQTQQQREEIEKEKYRRLMSSKYCDVKHCQNVPLNNPEKTFFKWPKSCSQRLKWLAVMKMKNKDTIGHCCQDHFDLEEDILNWSFDSNNRLELELRDNAVPRFNLMHSCDTETVRKNIDFENSLRNTILENSLYQNSDTNLDGGDHDEYAQVVVKTEYCDIDIKEEPLDIDGDASDAQFEFVSV